MDYTFSVSGEDEGTYINMSGEHDTWMEQADNFFLFLTAQSFILSEQDLANHFQERAVEMKDLRSNKKEKKNGKK